MASKRMKLKDLGRPLSSDSEGDPFEQEVYRDAFDSESDMNRSGGFMNRSGRSAMNSSNGSNASIGSIGSDIAARAESVLGADAPLRKYNNGVTSEDLMHMVEEEVEYQEGLVARVQDTNVSCITGAAERVLRALILMAAAPVLLVALVLMLVEIVENGQHDPATHPLKFLGLVVLPSLSYLGCLYMIMSHFLQTNMWSERRQLLMFSSWPGLIHYMCILYEQSKPGMDAKGNPHECDQSVTMVNQISFLMQMCWQVAMAHGVFRYLMYDKPVLSGINVVVRHFVCWGTPLIIVGFMFVTIGMQKEGSANAYEKLSMYEVRADGFADGSSGPEYEMMRSPFCGISDAPKYRGYKAVFVHAPQIVGVLLYSFFYFFVAATIDPSAKHGGHLEDAGLSVRTYEETRISTSPHHSLLHATTERRMLDISRAVIILRYCMAAFVLAYLLETIFALVAENFPLEDANSETLGNGWPASVVYYLRIFLVTPQQFVYACAFSNQRAGSVVKHVLDFHSATIKSSTGKVIGQVNTTVNRLLFEKTIAKPSKTVQMGARGAINRGVSLVGVVGDTSLSTANIFVQNDGISLGVWLGKTVGMFVQTLIFTPVAFFVWVPIHFIQNNYTEQLIPIFGGVVLFSFLVLFPFIYFQGDPNWGSEVVRGHVMMVLAICLAGVINNQHNPTLLVVDGPKETVRKNARNALAYGTVVVEFWQVPLLAVTACSLLSRYYAGAGGVASKGQREFEIGDYVLLWTFDDFFRIQWPLAVLGATIWGLFFCCAEAVAIVYRKQFDKIMDKFQVALYVFAGPGYLFIVKNLMKPLFCKERPDQIDWRTISLENPTGEPYGYSMASYKPEKCWSKDHLIYCTVSLFLLCVFLPSATLTNAIRFSAPEDVRFVYLYLRLELFVKSMMTFFSLATQGFWYLSLSFLILGSAAIIRITYLMQPCCQGHINRLKYLVHSCSIYMCLTCMVVEVTGNTSWAPHVASIAIGWFALGCVWWFFEKRIQKGDIFREAVSESVINTCIDEIDVLQSVVASNERTWATQAHILRLIKFSKHEHTEISKKAHESLAVLSYLDQMTEKDTFFAFAPNVCMELLCSVIYHEKDESVRSFAIRTLKTFLQEERYIRDIAEHSEDCGFDIAAPLGIVIKNSRQVTTKVDAGICLLAMCSIDSNHLKTVVELLPTLNLWMESGSLVQQHLALELIANLSSRFDLSGGIIAEDCLDPIFALCAAIDSTARNSKEKFTELGENKTTGFRKGLGQPERCENLAHQLPKNVIKDFSAQFSTVEAMLSEMADGNQGNSGPNSKLQALDMNASVAMKRLRSLEQTLSSDNEEAANGGAAKGSTPLSAKSSIDNPLAAAKSVGSAGAKLGKAAKNKVKKKQVEHLSIGVDDFLAWMSSGNFLSDQIEEKFDAGELKGVAKTSGDEGMDDTHYKQLFAVIDDDGSGDLDEMEFATFLEEMGLGTKDELEEILLDTGLRQRGLGELSSAAGSAPLEIYPEDFRNWLRSGASKDGLAKRMITTCLGETINVTTLTDEMIDGLFRDIDEDGGGSLDSDELATFLETEGLGGKDELEELLKDEMVGRSVIDTVVQMSAKQVVVMKEEMVSFVLHIIMELAGGMSGLGRREMIKNGVTGILLLGLRPDNPTNTRIVALQGIHALLSNKFSLDDVISDSDFEGYYADILQLEQQTTKNPDLSLQLIFNDLTPLQRRKVHVVSEFAGMTHISKGPPDSRKVIVSATGGTVRTGKVNTVKERKVMSESLDLTDPFDDEFYHKNRQLMSTIELVGILTVIAAETSTDTKVIFNALDVLVLFVKYDCVPEEKAEQVERICLQSLMHPTIEVAVLAAWALDYIVSRKRHLFAQKRGIHKFRSAGRRILSGIQVAREWRSVHLGGELDVQIKKSRTMLR
eukprot:SAG22_NODE_21_length_31784_cov_15.522897_6_plen_1900_part_00